MAESLGDEMADIGGSLDTVMGCGLAAIFYVGTIIAIASGGFLAFKLLS